MFICFCFCKMTLNLLKTGSLTHQIHLVLEQDIRLVLTSIHFDGTSLLSASVQVFIRLWLTKDLANGHQIQMAQH